MMTSHIPIITIITITVLLGSLPWQRIHSNVNFSCKQFYFPPVLMFIESVSCAFDLDIWCLYFGGKKTDLHHFFHKRTIYLNLEGNENRLAHFQEYPQDVKNKSLSYFATSETNRNMTKNETKGQKMPWKEDKGEK